MRVVHLIVFLFLVVQQSYQNSTPNEDNSSLEDVQLTPYEAKELLQYLVQSIRQRVSEIENQGGYQNGDYGSDPNNLRLSLGLNNHASDYYVNQDASSDQDSKEEKSSVKTRDATQGMKGMMKSRSTQQVGQQASAQSKDTQDSSNEDNTNYFGRSWFGWRRQSADVKPNDVYPFGRWSNAQSSHSSESNSAEDEQVSRFIPWKRYGGQSVSPNSDSEEDYSHYRRVLGWKRLSDILDNDDIMMKPKSVDYKKRSSHQNSRNQQQETRHYSSHSSYNPYKSLENDDEYENDQSQKIYSRSVNRGAYNPSNMNNWSYDYSSQQPSRGNQQPSNEFGHWFNFANRNQQERENLHKQLAELEERTKEMDQQIGLRYKQQSTNPSHSSFKPTNEIVSNDIKRTNSGVYVPISGGPSESVQTLKSQLQSSFDQEN